MQGMLEMLDVCRCMLIYVDICSVGKQLELKSELFGIRIVGLKQPQDSIQQMRQSYLSVLTFPVSRIGINTYE